MGICNSSNHHGLGPRFMPASLTGKEWFRLTYRSKLQSYVSMESIERIIKISDKNNKAIDVGGALWVDMNTREIRQILEGRYLAVNSLVNKIAQDRRHKHFVIEREEFPLSRFYSKWGGMALAQSPDFQQNIENKIQQSLVRSHYGFVVTDERVSDEIANLMMSKNVNLNIGGIFIYRKKDCELIMEGDKKSVEAISRKINELKETTEFRLLGTERPNTRSYTVLSEFSVARLALADQPEMQIKNVAEDYNCVVNNTVEMFTGIFFATLNFRGYENRFQSDSHEYSTPLRTLIREMEDQFQFNISTSKLKMNRSMNQAEPGLEEGSVQCEKRVSKLKKKSFTFKNRPLGFRIEVAGSGNLPKSDKFRYVCIPTTNTEMLSKGIPPGSGILEINGVDISDPNTQLKFVIAELQKSKDKPVDITFGVVKKVLPEGQLRQENDCLLPGCAS
mmetsp:Transcript_11195/g.18074  ORF Transcript_11195/g.18074 Transcript_11195/m.18074 type:complete len:448 (-) Transcript_11195:340-1683(-)